MATLGAQLFRIVRHPLKSYNECAKKAPFYTGFWTTGIKTSAADMFAQKVMEGKEEMDWKRHGMFCCFGFLYLGGFQYYLYNTVFSKLCAPITRVVGHIGVSPVKTLIDQCIHHPFAYFPVFYLLKGFVENRPLASSFEKYKAEMWPNLKALWMVWVPCQLINFGFVPRHLRIPFAAMVSFVWTIIISVMRGAVEVQQTSQGDLTQSDQEQHASFGVVTQSSLSGGYPNMQEIKNLMEAGLSAEEAIMMAEVAVAEVVYQVQHTVGDLVNMAGGEEEKKEDEEEEEKEGEEKKKKKKE